MREPRVFPKLSLSFGLRGGAAALALAGIHAVGVVGACAVGSGCATHPVWASAPDRAAPRERDYDWMSREVWWTRHRALVGLRLEVKRRAELVFLGDSITEGWDSVVFEEFYSRHHALRFGIGGDRTQQVLFRIENGELQGLSPKVLVLLIGTNNLGQDGAEPEAIARGVDRILQALAARLPRTQILLLGLLPRGERADDPMRAQIRAVNQSLSGLADGRRVRFADVGSVFLNPDGAIPKAWMADFLHPTRAGYRRFARRLTESLEPYIAAPSRSKSELHSQKDVLRLTLVAARSPFSDAAASF